jgi:hypothetical protein
MSECVRNIQIVQGYIGSLRANADGTGLVIRTRRGRNSTMRDCDGFR